MNFIIADSFTDSLGRLSAEEQKLAKVTVVDLQINPSAPGMSFHRVDSGKDKNFWSVRVGSDVRLIVHRSEGSMMVCYVDHHDKAYGWAERRKIEVHPTTGAAQLVEVRERVEEVVIKKVVVKNPLLGKHSKERLMEYGVPQEWLESVLEVETEEELFEVIRHLPRECGEALLSLAVGEIPKPPAKLKGDPFEHPDARRRFRVVATTGELEAALSYPWERWSVFLHPSQRELVEREYSGPARVSGAAGTGKTVVALHRAAHMARRGARVLLTTFSETLALQLGKKLAVLLEGDEAALGRVEVGALGAVAARLCRERLGEAEVASKTTVQRLLDVVSQGVGGHKFKLSFLLSEWQEVIDAWQLQTLEDYQGVVRVGRRAKVSGAQREVLWKIFSELKKCLDEARLTTVAARLRALGDHVKQSGEVVYDCVVVDEAQDLSVSQLRLLAALGGGRANSLFFAGDGGQRIFQQPYSWKELGVEVKGRAATLRVNYRTSSQIMRRAERLMASGAREDAEWGGEERGPVSVVSGPEPEVLEAGTQEEEAARVVSWVGERLAEGVGVNEVGVFVRSATELDRAQSALERGGWRYKVLDEGQGGEGITLCTMHLAKGLEFRSVVVMACDEDVIPLQARVELASDVGSSEDVYETERHLLYVACTRARDHLLVTSVEPASEFLMDLRSKPGASRAI